LVIGESYWLSSKAIWLLPKANWLLAEAIWLLAEAIWLLAEAIWLLAEAIWLLAKPPAFEEACAGKTIKQNRKRPGPHLKAETRGILNRGNADNEPATPLGASSTGGSSERADCALVPVRTSLAARH